MAENEEGGIGGIGAEPPGQRRVPRTPITEAPRPPTPSSEEGAPTSAEEDARDAAAAVAALGKQVADLYGLVEQQVGQIRQLEADQRADRAAIQNVFNQIDARLTAMAQQLVMRDRYLAAELAIRGRQPGEQADKVRANAQALLEFISPPAPEKPAESEAETDLQAPHPVH